MAGSVTECFPVLLANSALQDRITDALTRKQHFNAVAGECGACFTTVLDDLSCILYAFYKPSLMYETTAAFKS